MKTGAKMTKGGSESFQRMDQNMCMMEKGIQD